LLGGVGGGDGAGVCVLLKVDDPWFAAGGDRYGELDSFSHVV
jgi:hypothetical protein